MIPRLAAALLALAAALPSAAAPAEPAVRAEVDALLRVLEASGCRFNRNGEWHSAAEAKAHLLQKLAAVERRATVRSTEQFISAAASGSSLSGKPYLVRCADGGEATSADWLGAQLRALRARGASPRAGP